MIFMKKGIFVILLLLSNILFLAKIMNHLLASDINIKDYTVVENVNKLEALKDETIYEKIDLNTVTVQDTNTEQDVSWFKDVNKSDYYLYLPASFNRQRLHVNFSTSKETIISVYDKENQFITRLNNTSLTNVFSYDELFFVIETNVKKKSTYHVYISSSTIDTMMIDIDGGDKAYQQIIKDPKHNVTKTGNATLIGKDGTILETKMDSIKGRGNATWLREKKPFSIKLSEKTSVFGMNEAKKWILLSNYPDGSLSRNAVFFTLAKELGLSYTPEFSPVDLYINHKYIGSYLLTSKVEVSESRVDNNNNYLFELENHPVGSEIKLKSGNLYTVHNPDLTSLSSSEKTKARKEIKKLLDHMEDLMKNPNTKEEELAKVIDLESFAKYYWVQEMSLNFDACRGSNYLYVKNGKIYAGPIWDLDNTMNRSYTFGNIRSYYVTENSWLNYKSHYNWFRSLLKKEYFSKLVDRVFLENRDTFSKLSDWIENYYEEIERSTEMNYRRWSYSNMIKSQIIRPWRSDDKNYQDSKRILKNSYHTRLNWYLTQYMIYDEYTYEIEGKNEKKVSGNTLIIPKSAAGKKITIYGIKNNKKTSLKTFQLKEGIEKEKVEWKKRTSSSYKKWNYNEEVFSIHYED